MKICDHENCKTLTKKLYKCRLCEKRFCINCMYLICYLCHNYFTCFWCGVNHKKYLNNDETKFKCLKHRNEH